MALIVCPECGKEISDKSKVCVHCGYPLIYSKNTKCNINGEIYDFKEELPVALLEGDAHIPAIGAVRRKAYLSLVDGCDLVDLIREAGEVPESYTLKYPHVTHEQLYGKSDAKPVTKGAECPYCHTRDTRKISTASKVAHTAVFGIFSMGRNSNAWHCNRCGSDF